MALLALAAGVVGVYRQELQRLWTVHTLFDQDKIVSNFSNMGDAFLTAPVIAKEGATLPEGPSIPLPDGADDWIDARRITGLVVLHDGKITHESYHQGTDANDMRISWSVAKSALSLLTGQIVAEGKLSLDDLVVLHAPDLAGSAYDGVTVQDVLQMESGVEFDENYADPDSDINRMGRVIALGGGLDDFTAALTARDREPGAAWKYVSMDTHVLGMVLRGVTGQRIADLMADRLMGPAGMGPVTYLTDGEGVAFVLGGLNMRTRDYARLGLLVEQGGIMEGRQIVPEAWVDASITPSAKTAPGRIKYGYQWWVPADAALGEVMGRGVYGQYLYIDRGRQTVIAVNAADRAFSGPGITASMVAMFRAIAARQQPAG
ncbi:serine hydrolase [Jannaschia sp. AI_61]|uniref:serine hydrolase domain-containing protein n=1 Tax=Jannaschia sp. AI_61 TaxID=2829796 RepID=UPI002104781C|nr:serine hydrolase [Jannaschia sp. AI_61]